MGEASSRLDLALPVSFEQSRLGQLDEALRLEWLVTNGLGGYASSTVACANTRRYHGLLVAASHPPAGRTVLLAWLDEEVVLDPGAGAAEPLGYKLSTAEWADGTVFPDGF